MRTLTNAIQSGRIAQAYMLTGIRGTGKTTTARIIAKALNYRGPDGNAGPTTGPTDDCETCRAITEDRHPDVMEMDAASRTGVDDIREILDGVRYAPTSARYKVYIIDEVHMLSRQAFNALLKTLEEPPSHVIFIFATTEIRKVPVTVLSRCQRFDLRRVDAQTLADYYATICTKENVTAQDEALALIGRAADGSVRDGLSLLDQAIARGSGDVTVDQVRDMLGLADRSRVMDLLSHAVQGQCADALKIMNDLYQAGADPLVLMQDMLDITHVLTRLRAVPQAVDLRATMTPDALAIAKDLAGKLSMPTLGRAWQILLKGLGEVNIAPNPQAAAEMVVIRLSYAADLPDPADLLRKIKNSEGTTNASSHTSSAAPSRAPEPVALRSIAGGGGARPVSLPQEQVFEAAMPVMINSLAALDEALRAKGHVVLAGEVYQYVHLVKLEPQRLEFRPNTSARPTLASDLSKALLEITGDRWVVSVSGATGAMTLSEQNAQITKGKIAEAVTHPVVAKVLEFFPAATITIKQDH